ncbi:MAG: RNA-guided endonuclease InsQ/TnpB family protein [Acidimicrobiales bacterium]
MRRTYKFRLRPTARQHTALGACLDANRELYNAALQERRDAWRICRTGISYQAQSAQLSEIRTLRPDIAHWSFSSQQATLRRLNRAFAAFFRRVKVGETPGYPRFKAAHRFDSVEWPRDGDGCRWKPEVSRVYLQGIGEVKATVHRSVAGKVKTISIKREGRRWYLVLSCDEIPARPLEPTGKAVGIDVGIASFATTSDGVHIDNPRWARNAADKLARSQRVLTAKRRGSNNRRAARQTVAARHRKIANQRKDFHHKLARSLVTDFDVICAEDLKVKNMVARARPVPDLDQPGQFLPNGAAAKTGLNRSISDAGWAQFASILIAKAEEAGRQVIFVDPRHTSDGCDCGHIARGNRVSQAVFRCQACGFTADADEHAARRILRAGLARLVAQAA